MATERTPSCRVGRLARGSWAAPAVLASVGDPDGDRRITAIVALLVVIGLGLVMLAVWLFRTTRPDPEVLAPLELMGERAWRRGDPVWQRRRLDEVRPEGAEPLQPSVAPPQVDEAFDAGPTVSGFDDLHEDRDAEPRAVPGDPLLAGRTAPSEQPEGGPTPFDPPRLPPNRLPERSRVVLVEPAIPEPEFSDRPIDPGLMAAALAEIDDELARSRDDTVHDAPRPME